MKIELEIPDYEPEKGIQLIWEYDFTIEAKSEGSEVIIKANSAGLKSLALHLLTLAQGKIPSGHHLHYDESNSLEDGSCEFIIQKL